VVLYGSSSGLHIIGGRSDWDRDKSNVSGNNSGLDYFGSALTVGDFDVDDTADLVIGVPGASVWMTDGQELRNAGVANILYGTGQGLDPISSVGVTRQAVSEGRDPSQPIHADANNYFGGVLP
jgi:hypothetical protein